jgi:hypothetical protein
MDVHDKTLWAFAQDCFPITCMGEGTRVEGSPDVHRS